MKRGDFIRNVILGLAASMLPKILRPMEPAVETMRYDFSSLYRNPYNYRPYILYVSEEFLNDWNEAILKLHKPV